ncbi:hypothetical protein GCM10010468_72160 [Actinocorallia longicatena]|uniref:Regulator of septum formation n=1 Tax=Actinocorallia longicatena TaxID=111803 RepID=A0ABP6QKA2_9ACTN
MGCLGIAGLIVVGIVIKVALSLGGNAAVKGLDGLDDPDRDKDKGITKAGQFDPMSLRVGDCYKNTLGQGDTSQTVREVKAIPCAQPHNAEVFAEFTMTGSYPLSKTILDRCQSKGKAWAQKNPASYRALEKRDPNFGIAYFSNDAVGWKSSGSNRVLCSIVASTSDLGPKLPTL